MTFNPVEIEKILETMVILRDTREQDTARARQRYKAFGLPCRRAVLDYGDYTYDCVMPSGSGLYPDDQKRLYPVCAVERKMNLDELAQCFTHDRKRFEAEMVRCLGHGGRMYLLVENASWELLLKGGYRSRFRSNAFLASITAWMIRYDLQIVFCTEETSPVLIREILYRDLKERLTNGNIG